tara:strand:+ start:154 stop:780 length:627 start_codon:yes stop_codon:yes gene_type:complete
MKKITLSTKKYYEKKLDFFGNNFKGMNWSSKKSQYLRFEELIKVADLKNKTVHDVGCGNGEFLKFLIKKNKKIKFFLGSDISEKMINRCKKKYNKLSGVDFLVLDIANDKFTKKFDFVISSGIFNVKNNFNNKIWKKYVFNLISLMFESSKKACAINFLTPYTTYRDKNLFYMNLHELILELRKNITKKIIINHSYNLWEYTVYLYKK